MYFSCREKFLVNLNVIVLLVEVSEAGKRRGGREYEKVD